MKILIGVGLFLHVFSARGHDEVCKAEKHGYDICVKPINMITRMTEQKDSPRKGLVMKLDGDTVIAPNALSTLDPPFVRIEMPSSSERNQSALSTLTLYPDSFVGLSNPYSIFIMNANINLHGKTLNSLTNLQWLRFMDCGFTEVPTDMLESTPNLDQLSFESNYLQIIRPEAFVSLKGLRELHLEGNGITSLELGCFSGLENLEVLNVRDNRFTAVPGIFNGLTHLTRLDIDHAFDDKGFKLDILRDTPALTNLELGNNNITSLQPNMFSIVPQLESLSLFRNHIPSVPKGVFDKLEFLKVVHLAQNNIKTVEPGAFSGLNMNWLFLLDNKADKTIETGTFRNLTIKRLTLENSLIGELKPRAFDGLSANEVNLNRNKLTQIGADDFHGLDTKELTLSDNQIETIALNAFSNTKVKKLRLTGNPISTNKGADKSKWGLPESTEILM